MKLVIHKVEPPLASQSRKAGLAPDLIVLHATAGSTLSGAIATLRERGFSYHYLIDKDGSVHECCSPERRAFHAGNSYGPHEEAANVSQKQDEHSNFVADCSVNAYTIGISLVNLNDGVDPYTEGQLQSLRALIAELKGKFASLRWVTTHAVVSPRRKTDPKGMDWEPIAEHCGLKAWRPKG